MLRLALHLQGSGEVESKMHGVERSREVSNLTSHTASL